MTRDSTNLAIRQIQALYTLGPLSGMSDPQLIERFLAREDAQAQDAFACLVQRHGPMVMGVCRRMLVGSSDADDAFQAVFLVLARRARSIRRVERLKSWLYGVSVRTAKEVRRREAKHRKREGTAMDLSKVGPMPDADKGEWLTLLDEELDRLPNRFREPLMLCELNGTSRHDAALQLHLSEGTLSSRLSRGRALLRDRLARRGVTLGAGGIATLFTQPANAALTESLVTTTARLALSFTAGKVAAGLVPVAVASLAEGVLTMIAHAKLKVAVATMVLGMVGLSIVWATGPKPDESKAVESNKAALPDEKAAPQPIKVHGLVVDEAGRAVAGAEVRAQNFIDQETRAVTGADGDFAIEIRHRMVDGTALLARSAVGLRLGLFQYDYGLTEAAAKAPSRIVLKPGRDVTIRVVDASQAPIEGAAVEVAGKHVILASATTGPGGSARLIVPVDTGVQWIMALKSKQGFDYAEFGMIDEYGQSKGGLATTDLPATVSLTLDNPRTVRIRALDRDGKPLAGVGFYPWLVQKEGRRSQINAASRIMSATTGPDGVVTFDWLPKSQNALTFWPLSRGYAHRRVEVRADTRSMITAILARTETIRGRVVHADGSPALGIEVIAHGTGNGRDHGQAQARTAADGTYEMTVDPGEVYAVSINTKDWAASSHLDVVVREGQPVAGVDFNLTRGTMIQGTVIVGPSNVVAANQYVRLDQRGGRPPADLREPGDDLWREVLIQDGQRTDAKGHYSFRVGPGTYTLIGPPRTKNETITVKDEAEVIRDFRMPRPAKGELKGRVVIAGTKDKGVARAKVEVASSNSSISALTTHLITDAEGRFHTERSLDRTHVGAISPDGSLGAIVTIGAEDPEVIIPVSPTAQASGILLDEQGKIAANQQLYWGVRVYIGDVKHGENYIAFAPKVVTDAHGRFTLPELVIGQEYQISVMRERTIRMAGVVRPEKAGPIDLGVLQIGAYHEVLNDEDTSSFTKEAPDTGKVAPSIKATTLDGKSLTLDDYKGKYVLLDFWATWCAPCIAEIPLLQAIHEAFGKDGRFVILSLSVDEKIDEPKAFQAKRKLPWSQAFLGEGIHGTQPGRFGIIAIPAFALIGPDGKIIARGMRGDEIKKAVAKALMKTP